MCNRDCKNCKAWTMCGVNTREVRPNRVKWYAGFLNNGTQVTPAYHRDDVAAKAKEAALIWGETVSIKHTLSEQYQVPPRPTLGVIPDDGRTKTYIIDGQKITVDDPWFVMPEGPDAVIDSAIAIGLNINDELLEAAAKANGKAHMYGGKLGASRCWSFHSPVSNSVAKRSLNLYRKTGHLDLAAHQILAAGYW